MTASATSVTAAPRDVVASYDPTTLAGAAGGAALYRSDRLEDRYALAFHELAMDKNIVDAVMEDVKALSAALDKSPELMQVLKNPTMSRDEQAGILSQIASKIGAQKLTQNFLQLVAKKRRQAALPEILKAFQSEIAHRRGELVATVTSAAPLTDAQQAALIQNLSHQHSGARITLDVQVNPALLGGLTVRVGSRLYDRSLSGQLDRLQQQLNAAA